MHNFTRRELLRLGAATVVAELASLGLDGCGGGSITSPSPSPACSKLTDIEHVVILIQENRSFDHYFGSYRGVRGFSDKSMAFQQPDPANTSGSSVGVLLPFHLDTSKTNAACTHDITHDWVPQHQSWNNGAMDGFVSSRLPIDSNDAVLSMGYYNRADLPYYYALADAFTICDNYFCSVMGPTDPNRLYTMAASLDPDGKNGGPILQTIVTNRAGIYGRLTYTTMPEQLQARGISWKVYSSPDENVLGGILSDNVLSYFKNFQDPASVLHQNAFGPQFPVDFLADVASGNLPQVSWLVGSVLTSDHPPSPSIFGENLLSLIVSALTANPTLWAKTVLLVTYDENGGFFDHVAPVTAPLGTAGEYVTAPAIPDPTVIGSPMIAGPIGLGFRVPMLIISPFSRGGLVSSDLFDHTSVLRFLETLFGVEVPNLSAWRRATVGDLTSALNFKKTDQSIPNLPSTLPGAAQAIQQCAATLAGTTPYTVPSTQTFPTQESGTATHPSGVC
ncbi:alkaline phosphatase family protein [Alloacidobacterium dinghuense]|uniref:alkaline phosphatase family protein n=1 Tax=Alloacidobacterium dinghuense TaxID=2763107 RepID=UPI0020373AF3|nr:alkaline phosphatase family protein [Alloacidobacterium dinghuense]